MNVVSLLPRLLEHELERLLAAGFTGSVEIHIQCGDIRSYQAKPAQVVIPHKPR